MARYYCSDTQVTDLLPTPLTGSPIATEPQRSAKLRTLATEWVDSVFPSRAPFAPIAANAPSGWQVNSTSHAAGDATCVLESGTGNPAAGDRFRVVLDNQWSDDASDFEGQVDDTQEYRVVAFDSVSGLLTYEPTAARAWGSDSPVEFGPPGIVQQACAWYAAYLAFVLLRRNPLDEAALAARNQAYSLLQIDPDDPGAAQVQPGLTADYHSGNVKVRRV